jgi:PPOX class probable F420-dependent enzyme
LALDAVAVHGRWEYVQVLDDTLTWPEVSALLAAPRNYWLGTTTPSGAPHAAPVWGVVAGGTLYVCSERKAVKARNIAADPRVVVHLESGDDVVIVRGTAEDLGVPAQVPSVMPAFAAKYAAPDDQQYLPGADPGEAVYAIRPQSAMVWHLADYEASQRRWSS